MNRIKKLSLALVMCLAIVLPFGCSVDDGGKVDSPYENIEDSKDPANITFDTYDSYWLPQFDYKTMPVAVFNGVPIKVGDYSKSFIEEESSYIDLSECGVNTVYGLTEPVNVYAREVETALAFCEKYNLSYIPSFISAHTQKNDTAVKSAFLPIKYKSALGGVIIRDEPSYSEFSSIRKSISVFESVIPNKMYHVNLFPDYATQQLLYDRNNLQPVPDGGYTYAQYLKDYIDIVKPSLLSYDFYPLVGEGVNIRNNYFGNMSVIREQAISSEIPFWVYVQTCSFNGNVRIPNQSEMLWMVNTSLSYGAKGIQYFTNFLPNNTDEIFTGAMIDKNGNRTEVYDYVKRANAQIKAVDEVLMRSLSRGIIQVGTSPQNIPEKDLIENYGCVARFEGNHSIVGCFDYNGFDAYYITNNSLNDEDTIKITVDGEKKGYTILDAEKKDFQGTNLEIKLSAGNAVLVVVLD